MAGISLQQLADQTHTARVVRVLPNVTAQIRKSYTPWVANAAATPDDRVIVARVFGACGACDEVGAESHDAVAQGLVAKLQGFEECGERLAAANGLAIIFHE
jgi:pyrroline-5-carboxylate reductase